MKIDLRNDNSEIVQYDYDGYMAYIRKSRLENYNNYSADSHWHDDIELMLMTSGSLEYNINGEIVALDENEGILINSRHLHFGFSSEKQDCEFICVLIHPIELCTSPMIEKKFIQPVISNLNMPFIVLKQEISWQKDILCLIKKIYESREMKTAPLIIQSCFYEIWQNIFDNAVEIDNKESRNTHQLSILKNIISFMQNNFADNTTLADIANAGNISKSTCLTLFKKYINDTPTNYLINYRLKVSTELLLKTDKPVSDIAFETGFNSPSYYCECFKRVYFCTPRKYRNQYK